MVNTIMPASKLNTFLHSLDRFFTKACGIILVLVGAYMAWAAWWNIDELLIKSAVLLLAGCFIATGAWYLYREKRS